jgi:hypothetical protein
MRDVDNRTADLHSAGGIRQETLDTTQPTGISSFLEHPMNKVCAQFTIEVTFDTPDVNRVHHGAIERVIKEALDDRFAQLMRYGHGGGSLNPLVTPMDVTLVKYETTYPHPDNLPYDMTKWTAKSWTRYFRETEAFSNQELMDRVYVAQRIQHLLTEQGRTPDLDSCDRLADQIAEHVFG